MVTCNYFLINFFFTEPFSLPIEAQRTIYQKPTCTTILIFKTCYYVYNYWHFIRIFPFVSSTPNLHPESRIDRKMNHSYDKSTVDGPYYSFNEIRVRARHFKFVCWSKIIFLNLKKKKKKSLCNLPMFDRLILPTLAVMLTSCPTL
jgi:hypothetical protein